MMTAWHGASPSHAPIRSSSRRVVAMPIVSASPSSSPYFVIPASPSHSWSNPSRRWYNGWQDFAGYARRPQTMTDHAQLLAKMLGLRSPTNADLPMMIEAAAQAAWSTERGQPIAAAVVSALRAAGIILPASSVIERAAIAGRARARRRASDALLTRLSEEQITKLDRLLQGGAYPRTARPAAARARHRPGGRDSRRRP
jgi:hypothetical protein